MMPRGQPRLLPAMPGLIGGGLGVAVMLSRLPLGRVL